MKEVIKKKLCAALAVAIAAVICLGSMPVLHASAVSSVTVKLTSGGSKKTIKLTKGSKRQIIAKKGSKTLSRGSVKYSSNKKSVATVSSSGRISAKRTGTAKITVKKGSRKAFITVKVVKSSDDDDDDDDDDTKGKDIYIAGDSGTPIAVGSSREFT